MTIHFQPIIPYIPDILKGFCVSLFISAFAALFGTGLGLLIYLGKTNKNKFISFFCSAYIELFRNTPLLVQVYLIYFGLAQFGLDISALATALFALSVNTGAYNAENLRAGFKSVTPGTVEAGVALAMTKFQVFYHIKLMPAFRSAFPSLMNQLVMLFLSSSVVSVIAVPELFNTCSNIDARIARTFEIYLVAGVLYYVTSFLVLKLSRRLEKKIFRW